jgi:SAM-dependent methyltransferase
MVTVQPLPFNPLEGLLPLMRQRGASVPAEEFQQIVNSVYRNREAETYDEMHRAMWLSLPEQLSLLVDDCLNDRLLTQRPLRVLDVRCGTGASADALWRTRIGTQIHHVDLLDTSAEMLQRCGRRASIRTRSHSLIQGTLSDLPQGQRYGLILSCSALHHLPTPTAFCESVSRRLAPLGVFLHLQDPNGEYLEDHELRWRMQRRDLAVRDKLRSMLRRARPGGFFRRIRRGLTGLAEVGVIEKVNSDLLRSGVIQSPMDAEEIGKITDLRVHDGHGISIEEMKAALPDLELVSVRAYAFFGRMRSELPLHLAKQEDDLVRARARNGLYIGAAWKRIGVAA